MEALTGDGAEEFEPQDTSVSDTRRWLRDLGALLALPALWVDHEPYEIATGLLSVLFGVLELEGAYARFDDTDGTRPLETWRPSGASLPIELERELEAQHPTPPGLATTKAEARGVGSLRVARLPLALPWGTGLVLVSAARSDFPTELETHLLRVAVSQAAIAIHTARRLAREHAARSAAEDALVRQNQLLRSLVDDVEPSLAEVSRRVHEVSRAVTEIDAAHRPRSPGHASVVPGASETSATARDLLTLSRRELEVLGLLAQGLSNKEIAGVMWLSDRTVERHITGLYRKIGVARRSEATAFALRHGVV
ncbi:response regulator transcription factor [Herbiconiux sp. P16]|uniref:helix-turn-helix transcriptional regulator n=1 Tax=Herbiconiux wuyangfengii TaxID=3342794 RepID=UPI0035B8CE8F